MRGSCREVCPGFRRAPSGLLEDTTGDDLADLLDRRGAQAEHAVDRLREKFGKDAVVKGLTLKNE